MIEVIRLMALDDIDATHWNGLLERSETNEIFLTHEWMECWWSCFGQDSQLYVLVAKEHDRFIGIAPLMLRTQGWAKLRSKVVEFLGTGEADYCDFIVASDDKQRVLREFFAYMRAQSDTWDVVSLQNIPRHAGTMGYLQELLHESKYNVREFADVPCPTLLIQHDPTFALECTKKKSLKRHFNYFDRNGRITFRTAQTADEIFGELENFFQQHVERRAMTVGPSKFGDSRARDFYRCLVSRLFPHNWLKFGIVAFDDVPIAYHFGFEYFKKFVWYKPTFDVKFAKHSPGEVLLKYLLEEAIQNQLSEFDFTIGEEPFKLRFSNEIRNNCRIEIVRNKTIWIVQNTIDGVRHRVKNRLPKVFLFLKTLSQQHRRS